MGTRLEMPGLDPIADAIDTTGMNKEDRDRARREAMIRDLQRQVAVLILNSVDGVRMPQVHADVLGWHWSPVTGEAAPTRELIEWAQDMDRLLCRETELRHRKRKPRDFDGV